MKIRRKYTPIYRDATALLRPKTGLNDMVIELDPGSQTAGTAPAGWTVPINQTLPNVNFDEILSSLDTDTRSYLQLLVGAAGEGLDGQGKALSADLKRFEPTGRYLAKLNGALAVRERNIRRVDPQLPPALAGAGRQGRRPGGAGRLLQPRSSRPSPTRTPTCARRCRSCPARSTRRTPRWRRSTSWARCSDRPSAPCDPAPAPSARRWSRRARSSTQTTPIIQNQLRPFARAALPVVKVLRPAARDLAVVTPKLTTSVKVLNYLLNELAYNPPGKEEGYLFWARGPTTTAPRSSPPRTRTARSATAWSWPLLDAAGAAPAQRARAAARHARRAAQPARPERRVPDDEPGRRDAHAAGHDADGAGGAHAARARPGEEPLMQKQAPSLGRILVMAGFALSCFGLLLFLWLAFGGPIPLQPKGYRFNVVLPRGRHAVPGGRRADLRRLGGQGQGRSRPTRRPAPRTRRSSSTPRTRRSPRTRRRSCARRRCWARPTSS